MIGLLARILRILNSETDPAQIAGAVALASIFGLTPLWSLHNIVVLLLVLVLRVNLSSFIVSWGLFTVLAFLLDPLFDVVGHAVLTAGWLHPVWAAFYSTDLGRFSDFNNTIVMGSLLISLVALPFVHLGTAHGVREYRSHVLAWMRDKPIYQVVRHSRLFAAYYSLRR